MNLRDVGHFARASLRCRICDADHLKERLIEEWRHLITASLIELSISLGSDCRSLYMRTEDSFNTSFKRWDCYHFLG